MESRHASLMAVAALTSIISTDCSKQQAQREECTPPKDAMVCMMREGTKNIVLTTLSLEKAPDLIPWVLTRVAVRDQQGTEYIEQIAMQVMKNNVNDNAVTVTAFTNDLSQATAPMFANEQSQATAAIATKEPDGGRLWFIRDGDSNDVKFSVPTTVEDDQSVVEVEVISGYKYQDGGAVISGSRDRQGRTVCNSNLMYFSPDASNSNARGTTKDPKSISLCAK